MKLGAIIGGLLALIVSTAAVVAIMSPRVTATRQLVTNITKPVDDGHPSVSPTAPWPKAFMDETEYDFGRMEVGEEQFHEFIIENRGDAPLIIKQGPSTCQCTVSQLETGELAPGASAKVTLKWKPTAETDQFGKGADLWTNDPKYRTIHLRILGIVAARVITVPSKNWEVPDIQEGVPGEIGGGVLSPVVDKFSIVGFESKSPLVSAEAFPLSEERLAPHKGLCGYEIRVSVKPEMPVGAFKFPLTIKTDLLQRDSQGELTKPMDIDVLISGHRRGPIKVIGTEWIEDRMGVAMGSFDAAVGKKVTLPLFVHGATENMKLTEPPVCDPPALKVTLARDEKSKGPHARFLLGVEYPAGSPRAHYTDEKPATVKLRLNQPGAEEFDLTVYFNAY
jgi:hypothetical protein